MGIVDTKSLAAWDQSEPDPAFVEKHIDHLPEWRRLRAEVAEIAAAHGWTKAEVTRRSAMTEGTFSQWYSGSYPGRLDTMNGKMARFVETIKSQAAMPKLPISPSFVRTRMVDEICQTLQWAQLTADMVMVTVAAGNGKTVACRHYRATHPNVFLATVSPHTRTVHAMLIELAAELGVRENNPARLTRAIGARLERVGGGTLLIVDEAQNLVDDAINQLRHFSDVYQCGIALVGNEEVYSRFVAQSRGRSYAQLKRRIGKRLMRSKPYNEDIAAYIAAWGIECPDSRRLLTGIGFKGGALGQVDKTMKLAAMLALGEERDVTVRDIEAAWKNRDVEDMA